MDHHGNYNYHLKILVEFNIFLSERSQFFDL